MRTLMGLLCIAGLAACGDGGSSNLVPPPPNVSPGGLWTAQWTEASGPTAGDAMSLKALVTENGDFFYAGFDSTNGCAVVGFGRLAVNGSAVSGTTQNAVVTYAGAGGINTGCAYPDGSTYGSGTVSGTISERSTANITVASQTALGLALPSETHTWAYNGLYALPSSLATIAGNYADGANTITISANGAIYEQDPASGCVINGTVSILNATYNAYGISFTFSNCSGQSVLLNGLTANGLGYVDNTASPNQVLVALKLAIGGQTAVIIGSLTRM
ncbi:MAG: hypothetical protein JSR54_13605 [Proteobacteria bacterium]|nr:hypothetical protein [Pseudomonadota bacterium]